MARLLLRLTFTRGCNQTPRCCSKSYPPTHSKWTTSWHDHSPLQRGGKLRFHVMCSSRYGYLGVLGPTWMRPGSRPTWNFGRRGNRYNPTWFSGAMMEFHVNFPGCQSMATPSITRLGPLTRLGSPDKQMRLQQGVEACFEDCGPSGQ